MLDGDVPLAEFAGGGGGTGSQGLGGVTLRNQLALQIPAVGKDLFGVSINK
ncbi:hypothetical protein [Corynebacterium macginleyi]|uniref:hypothetical protein n=1 Tax=Corynebacterium macginleyi TaxID=38290 RepID=UPI00190B012F|nr:hypothetical protein [Corynebacterium macginleyi]